jgi:hypothetical protein
MASTPAVGGGCVVLVRAPALALGENLDSIRANLFSQGAQHCVMRTLTAINFGLRHLPAIALINSAEDKHLAKMIDENNPYAEPGSWVHWRYAVPFDVFFFRCGIWILVRAAISCSRPTLSASMIKRVSSAASRLPSSGLIGAGRLFDGYFMAMLLRRHQTPSLSPDPQ